MALRPPGRTPCKIMKEISISIKGKIAKKRIEFLLTDIEYVAKLHKFKGEIKNIIKPSPKIARSRTKAY